MEIDALCLRGEGNTYLFAPEKGADFQEQFNGLPCERHNVVTRHFHAGGRDAPFGGGNVDLGPFCLADFDGAEHHIRGQPESNAGL